MVTKRLLELDLPKSGVGLTGTRRILLIFGWFVAKPIHVRKYATVMRNVCQDKDLTTLYTVAPWAETLGYRMERIAMTKWSMRTKWAESVVKELKEHCGSMPLLEEIHVLAFSNGGAWPCMDVCAVLKEDQLNEMKNNSSETGSAGFVIERLRGIVFDSAPAHMGLNDFVRMFGFHPQGWLGRFERWFSGVQSVTQRQTDGIWELIVNDNPFPDMRQLVLYSREDLITDAKKLEELVERRKKLGIEIKAHRFVGSPHVEHMRMFPDEYVGVLLDFMKCSSNKRHSDDSVVKIGK